MDVNFRSAELLDRTLRTLYFAATFVENDETCVIIAAHKLKSCNSLLDRKLEAQFHLTKPLEKLDIMICKGNCANSCSNHASTSATILDCSMNHCQLCYIIFLYIGDTSIHDNFLAGEAPAC